MPAMPLQLVVSPETARILALGHPWVIADAHTRRWPRTRPGDIAHLVDAAGGFLATALLDPADRVVARVLSFERIKLDEAWLRPLLEAALRLRRHARREETNAWRLVNGEGDGLPGVVVEQYRDYLLVQLYSEAWEPHQHLLFETLARLVGPAGIYLKRRPRQTRNLAKEEGAGRLGRLVWGRAANFPLRVRENGLNFLVDLEQGLHTGLFLDQRVNRRDFMARAEGKTVLNLFAYTGAFSVAAAAAGAVRVTSVDAARASLDWARANFAANDLDAAAHEFVVEDCFVAMERLRQQGRRFDLIFMDPPSFSTTRKSRFTTRGGTAELVELAAALLEPEGVLICSSNHQKVDLADFLKELRRGSLAAGRPLRVIATHGQPEDFPYPLTFPEGRYLKYVIMSG